MAEINVALLNRVADYIEAHPEQYDQDAWMLYDTCGTRGCIAGWAITLADDKDRERLPIWIADKGCTYPMPADKGQYLLGLTYTAAKKLFDSCAKPPTGMTVPDWLRFIAMTGVV